MINIFLLVLFFPAPNCDDGTLMCFKKKERKIIKKLMKAEELHTQYIGIVGVTTKQFKLQKKLSKKGREFFEKLLTLDNKVLRGLAILELIKIDSQWTKKRLALEAEKGGSFPSFLGGWVQNIKVEDLCTEGKEHPLFRSYFNE